MSYRRKLFAILFRSRVRHTDEVKFDFLLSCANIDVSRMLLSVPSGEREGKVKGRRRKATSVFHDLTSLCVFFLRVSDTANIDTKFYLRFHTSSQESCARDTPADLLVSIRRTKILRYMFENNRQFHFKFIDIFQNWTDIFSIINIVDAFTENKLQYTMII